MSGDNVRSLADRRQPRTGYAAGVPPFDPTNPAHIEAWNSIFALGRSEIRFREMERRARAERTGFEVVT